MALLTRHGASGPSWRGFTPLPGSHGRKPVVTGFTLLEMVIAIGFFSVAMVLAVGIAIHVERAEEKTSSMQAAQDDLRFALESMAKEIRYGTSFRPVGGVRPRFQRLTFLRSDNCDVTYRRVGATARIERRVEATLVNPLCPATAFQNITGSETLVQDLEFYVIGDAALGDAQPRITVSIRGAAAHPRVDTKFELQTTISPRDREES